MPDSKSVAGAARFFSRCFLPALVSAACALWIMLPVLAAEPRIGEAPPPEGLSLSDGGTVVTAHGSRYKALLSPGTLTQQAYLNASSTVTGDDFEGSVAIDGDTATMGAIREDGRASNTTRDRRSLDAGAASILTIRTLAAPVMGSIPDRSVSEDGTAVVHFVVSDSDTDLDTLSLVASSANTVVVPNSNISLGGTGSNRTATIVPAANRSGNARISITASDGSSIVTNSFLLTVTPVNDAPSLNALSDIEIPRDAGQQTVSLSGINAGSLESQPLRITASSSNAALIPDPNVTYTSPQSSGSIRFTPVPGSNGIATITVTVEDGGFDANLNTAGDNAAISRTFMVTVAAGTNANVSGLVLSSGTLNPSFSATTTNYSTLVSNAVSSITVTPTLADAFASVTVNGSPVVSGVASGPIPLNTGANLLTVLATAQDGSASMTYRVSVTREPPPLPLNPSMTILVMTGSQVQVSINAVTGLYYYLLYPTIPLSQVSSDPIDLSQWSVADSEAPATHSPISLQDPTASTQTGRVYSVLIRNESIPPP